VSDGPRTEGTEFIEAWAPTDPRETYVLNGGTSVRPSKVHFAVFVFCAGNVWEFMTAICRTNQKFCLECIRSYSRRKSIVVLRLTKKPTRDKVINFFYFRFYAGFTRFLLADSPVQVDSGDLCVMTAVPSTAIKSSEKLRFFGPRIYAPGLGLPRRPFQFLAAARAAGDPQYSSQKLLRLVFFFLGLTSFSTRH